MKNPARLFTNTLFVQTDLGSSAGIQKLADRVFSEWGGVDILVNCVGGSDAPNGVG